MADDKLQPGGRAQALAYFYAFNVILLMVCGHSYLANIPAGTSVLGWLQTLLAFLANFALMAVAPMVLVLPTLLTRRLWITLTAAVVFYGLLNVFVYVDSVIYQLWRFHFNGMVLNLLTTSGAGDSVTAGRSTVVSAILIVVSIFAAEAWFAGFGIRWLRSVTLVPRLETRKAIALSCAGVFALVFLDKALYNVGDLRDDVEVVRLRHLLPLYQTVTMHRFANRVLGIKTGRRRPINMEQPGGLLDYPKAPLRFRPDGPRPNILIVAIEGARWDMLTPAVMPQLARWGEQHLVFDNHYSAGNTTRYGIFGLFYGIYGTYWHRALAEQQPPVLIRSLKEFGYRFRILSSTDLNYPEFRRTCFIDVPEAVTDKWTCERVARDRLMTDEFIKFLDDKPSPFLAFMFYDASHQPYHYPAEHAVFDVRGATEDINYVKLAHTAADLRFVMNRYKNSLHYTDAQLGRALQALRDRGLTENTLVFICGDHGEEFGEFGLFGHDSTFSAYQTKTLMVANIPGEAPRRIERLTSHSDVPATILNYLGVENRLADFSQGRPMLEAVEQPYVFIASWGTAAVVDRQTTIAFGMEAYNADTTIFDNRSYQPLPNQREAIAARSGQLVSVLNEMRHFTK